MTTTTDTAQVTKLVVTLPADSWYALLGPLVPITKAAMKAHAPSYCYRVRMEVRSDQGTGSGQDCDSALLTLTATDRYVIHRVEACIEASAAQDAGAWDLPPEAVELLAPPSKAKRKGRVRRLVLTDDGLHRRWWIYNPVLPEDEDPDLYAGDYGVLLDSGDLDAGSYWPEVTGLLDDPDTGSRGTTAVGVSLPVTEVLVKMAKAMGASSWWLCQLGAGRATGNPAQVIWTDVRGREACQVADHSEGVFWRQDTTVIATVRQAWETAGGTGTSGLWERSGLDHSPWVHDGRADR